jgi:hypothetical protein
MTRTIRCIATAATAGLLALAGAGLAAVPAYAAARPASRVAALPGGSCSGFLNGQSQPINVPIRCTVSYFSPALNPNITSTETGSITLTNTTKAPEHVLAMSPFAMNPGKPGGARVTTNIPAAGVELPAGHSATLLVRTTLWAPWWNQTGHAESNIPSSPLVTNPLPPQFSVTSPAWAGVDRVDPYYLFPVVGTPPPPPYGVAVSVNPPRPVTGRPAVITARDSGSRPEVIEVCTAGGHPLAAGVHQPGTALVHAVVSGQPGTVRYLVHAGPRFGCGGAGANRSLPITWTGDPYTGASAPVLAVVSNPHPLTTVADPIWGINTSASAGWVTLCDGSFALAAGWREPGGAVVHAVGDGSGGPGLQSGLSADLGPHPGCGNPSASAPISIDWASSFIGGGLDHALALLPGETTASTGSPVAVWVLAERPEWLSLCTVVGIGTHLLASGYHAAGTVLEYPAVAAGAGTQDYIALAAARRCYDPAVPSATPARITWTG